MPIFDQLKSHLSHGGHELRQALQLLPTVVGCIQTAADDFQVCNDLVELIIGPAFEALNRQNHGLNEEMDRVFALRHDESTSYLKEENAKLKRDLAAALEGLRRETEAELISSNKPNTKSDQHIQYLEGLVQHLKIKLNEMREKYESAIIENLDLKNHPAFKVYHEGVNLTIESGSESSPDEANLHHNWIPQLPAGAGIPLPDILPHPELTNLNAANKGSTDLTIRNPGRPKARPIIKGTKATKESFERMRPHLFPSPAANIATASASGATIPIIEPFDVHRVTPSKIKSKLNPAVQAFAPSNSSSKDFAKSGSVQISLSENALKPSAIAGTTRDESSILPHLRRPNISIKEKPVTTTEELSVREKTDNQGTIATGAYNESTTGAEPHQATSLTTRILPHLRRITNAAKDAEAHPSQVQRSSKGKNKEDGTVETELLPRESALTGMKENVKAATTPGAFVRSDPGLEAWLDSQEKVRSHNAATHESAFMPIDTLIQIDPDDSPKAGEKKTVPLPPGFIPISTKKAPSKTEAAAPVEINQAAYPTAANDRVTARKPTAENAGTARGHEVTLKYMSEEEMNARFMTEYDKNIGAIADKYARVPRKGLATKDAAVDPAKYSGAEPNYIPPPPPTGTRELGALLDAECSRMVLKPRAAVNAPQENATRHHWTAIRKDGKVVYVL